MKQVSVVVRTKFDIYVLIFVLPTLYRLCMVATLRKKGL